MLNKPKIEAVDVYLEKRKTREYVGRLSREGKKFIFIYNDSYLYKGKAIPLGPDLPLTKKKFISELFSIIRGSNSFKEKSSLS